MICNNCNAHFDDNLPECPYCGAFHYAGAEKEYLNKLEDMKEDLDDLHQTVPEMYTKEFQKQGKQARKIVLIIFALLTACALLFLATQLFMDSRYEIDPKAQLLFTKEAFPIADEYYNAGDYEGLLNFYQTSLEENENATFVHWEHYTFLICYEHYVSFEKSIKRFDSEDFSVFDMKNLFYCYISNHYHQKGQLLSADELLMVTEFEEQMKPFFDNLQLTDKEQRKLNNLLNSSEYPSWDDISDFAKKIYKRL